MLQTETVIFIVLANVVMVLLVAGLVSFTVQFRNRRLLHQKEKKALYENHQKEILTAQLEVQQQTMQHIGREIHDNVGQKLTLASLYVQQLEFTNHYPGINQQLLTVGSIINESLAELRSLSKSLTDTTIQNVSLQQLIQAECRKIDTMGSCLTHFSSNEKETNMDAASKSMVLRMVQEFMQNSLKHSNCTLINIQLKSSTEGIHLLMGDNGCGFDTNHSYQGMGLNNIAKRAAMLNAQLALKSIIGKGTTLELLIPSIT